MKPNAAKASQSIKTNDVRQQASDTENTGKEMSGVLRNAQVSLDLKNEKLAYILQMLEELRKLSNTMDEPMIAYLIEMAVLETNTALNVSDLGMGLERERRAL